jgi:hypothetical protein
MLPDPISMQQTVATRFRLVKGAFFVKPKSLILKPGQVSLQCWLNVEATLSIGK